MQYVAMFLFSLFGFGIKELVLRAAVALGFGVMTTYGMYALFDQVKSHFNAQLTGLPSDVLALLGIMQIDIAFTMILSAAAAKQVLLGWNKLLDKRSGRVWQAPGSGGSMSA